MAKLADPGVRALCRKESSTHPLRHCASGWNELLVASVRDYAEACRVGWAVCGPVRQRAGADGLTLLDMAWPRTSETVFSSIGP